MRPPGSIIHRRVRKRGPRSREALLRRRRTQDGVSSPVVSSMPQGGDLRESGSILLTNNCSFIIFHVNIRGFLSKAAELQARILMMPVRPSIICLTETWLSPSTARAALVGYSVVVRRDRDDGRNGGGVIIFAIDSLINNVVPIYVSIVAERVWCLIHSDTGPFLVCAWYRPPDRGEVLFISSLREEYTKLHEMAIGIFIVGDMNVHQIRWLHFSRENSLEGVGLVGL